MTRQQTEKDARLDALVRDLRHPLVDVSESEAALVEYVREAQAQAWAEGHAAGQDYAGDGGCDRPGCAHDPRDDNPYLSIPPAKNGAGA